MVEYIIAVGIVVALAVGFYMTRGGGGIPGGFQDPALNQMAEYTPLGDHLPIANEDNPIDEEHHIG
jgi:hypothetical protein